MDGSTKAKLDRRLARLEGQVAGLRRMVRDDRYCIEILTQLSAVRAALDQVGAEMVASHMRTCILGRGTGSEHECSRSMTQEELVDELRLAVSRLMR